jgi:hypothetical protein
MPNALTKDLEIMFDNMVEGFDAACVVSSQVARFSPGDQSMQRAGDVVYRPQDYHMDTVSGLDVSAATPTDLVQRMVPAVYKSPENIVYTLDAKEMRDPYHMAAAGKASGKRLAAKVDSDMASAIMLRAGNVVTQSGVFGWDLAATAKRILKQKGVPMGVDIKMIMNPLDTQKVALELGQRSYYQGQTKDSFENGGVPDIAGMRTFETDISPTLAAIGTVTGITLGAIASFTPTAMTGDLPTDNRQQTITVAGANIANAKNGDAFTLANSGTPINSVHMITKEDTGEPQTFRVLSGGGTATLTITPALVASGPYRNVTAQGASGATLTFKNTAAKSVTVGFAEGAVELMTGNLAFPSDQGPKVVRTTSKNGIPLVFAYVFDAFTGKTKVRVTSLYGTTVLQPELCFMALASQP